MAQEERDVRSENLAIPDRSQFIWVDPEKLMRDNPAALIVNTDTYASMEAHFSEARFLESHPEAAWVEIYTPQGITEILLETDGLTRTKFARDHKGKVLPEAPNVRFDQIQVFNITAELLQDPRIVPPEERRPGQRALTMEQFLRAVIKPTIAHQEIAPDRIAGHLMNAWVGWVGPDLAERFPAVSALSFLADSRTSKATDDELRKTLARQDKIVVDEQREERDRLNKGLRSMAAIIRESKLQWGDVEQAAYFLVGSGSDVIGGSVETRNQIHGLLRSGAFERKLAREYTQRGPAENIRLECAGALEEAFKRFADRSQDSERCLQEIRRAVDDESLTIGQTVQIVTSAAPDQEHFTIIRDKNRETLRIRYLVAAKKQNLTPTEQLLIGNLGGQTFPLESKIPSMVADIQFTVALVRQSQDWQEQLQRETDELVVRGVNEATINRAVSQMAQRQQALLTANSLGVLPDRIKQLQNTIAEFRETIAREILEHEVGIVVDKVFEQELKTSKDPQLRKRIIWAATHAEDVNATDSAAVIRWVRELKRLDQDLRTEVTAGHFRLDRAVRLQRNKKVEVDTPRIDIRPAEAVAPSQDTSAVKITPQLPVVEPSQFQVSVSQEEIRRRRVEANVRRLNTEIVEPHFIPAIRLLATLDLDPKDVPPYLKKFLGEAETAIERLRTGHPDVVRVMDEDYPHLIEKVKGFEATIVDLQRQLSDRDTHTGR